ncbi:hypothetical protein [Chitinophaga sp.]|uniref:hypothetical protein n=1 Tax=Chitinophaga sp. TaxID=1869181 RepID=UPI002F956EB7
MDYVIEMGNVQSVGGFKVSVGFNNGAFNFVRYNRIYRGNISLLGDGEHTIGHGDASEGAYSVHFFEGASNYKSVALHIRQAQLGILYHRNDNGLLKSNLSKYDEIDFIDNVLSKYQIPVQVLTQDRVRKYLSEGKKYFDAKKNRKSSELFGQSLIHATGKEKAVSLFYLGLAQLNMNNRNMTMFCFNEAVKIDPAIKTSITIAFQNKTHK